MLDPVKCSPGQQCTPEKACFKHKVRTLVMGTSRRKATREWRDPVDGHRIKQTRDDATKAGNLTTEHNTKDDRVDVLIRPDAMHYELGRKS